LNSSVNYVDKLCSIEQSAVQARRHLFSFTYGGPPVSVFHQAKQQLDALMLRYLRALARLRGEYGGWAGELRRIVSPPPAHGRVMPLRGKGA
jgi:hypothetical protein